MGKRGPAPKPTKLKLLHGETRPSQINSAEPQPSPGVPERPEWLDDDAKEMWDLVVGELEPTGVLCRVDGPALAILCESLVHHRQAAERVDREGTLVLGRQGLVKHPAMQVARDQALVARAFMQEFGMTPSARSQIRVPGRGEEGLSAARLLS